MFDGLKKKLNSFREDVEDTAEEKAEAEAEADAEAEAEAGTAGETEPGAAETPADVDSAAGAETSEDALADADPSADADAETVDTDAESGPTDADAPSPADGETESGAATAGTPTDDTGAGISGETTPEPTADADARTPEEDPETPSETPDGDATAASEATPAADDGAGAVPTDADADADANEGSNVDAAASPAEAETVDPADERVEEAPADADADSEEAPPRERLASDAANEALQAGEKKDGAGRLKRAAAFATGKVIIEEEDLEDPLWELEMALLESDVEMHVAEEILETIRDKMIGESRRQVQTMGQLVHESLHDALYDVISIGQFDFDQRIAEADKPVTLTFTGVNGVGKTTSIAKMARYFENQGLSVVIANGDTYRAGANEQIRKHAENLDTKLITHEQGGDPAAVIYDAVEYAKAHDIDVVLGDTAGRLHTSNDLMAQLEKIDRVVSPDMTLFVDEAVAGQDAVERSKQFNDAAEIDGAILTKADADSNGGAAISIAYVTGKPILFLGVGQGYDDIERFDPELMVDRLLGDEE
ncbi:signal recognition particle-docking protein FtsY [Halogeometricum luteum]|uniref:Signal recognition particle receptor FtsY n=1 Tax=Halogeometricum luteum TaxID=2950537 RepID=A0ABU2G6K6_9EURY|nr:signal recognition particle-docking protein FtsY [Halogeometricum sp. S3BR5-2]MDS0295939.1 signal recognition particle-docking protein FtsY [Halogeometricum sp. S3BR5-2]